MLFRVNLTLTSNAADLNCTLLWSVMQQFDIGFDDCLYCQTVLSCNCSANMCTVSFMTSSRDCWNAKWLY
jgi:hypothetical protein